MPNNYPVDFMVDLIRFLRRAPSLDEAIELVRKFFSREDVFDVDGQMCLHIAARLGDRALFEKLVAMGGDPDARDERGWTPIMVAAVVEAGYHPNPMDELGQTPLHFAVRNGDVATVEAFCRAGFSPNAPNKKGATPLDLAQQLEKLSPDHRDAIIRALKGKEDITEI